MAVNAIFKLSYLKKLRKSFLRNSKKIEGKVPPYENLNPKWGECLGLKIYFSVSPGL